MLRKNYYWDNLYKNSCAEKYGLEISQFTKDFSRLLCEVHVLEFQYRLKLSKLINNKAFKNYNLVFDQFEFNYKLRAIIRTYARALHIVLILKVLCTLAI